MNITFLFFLLVKIDAFKNIYFSQIMTCNEALKTNDN